MGIILKKIKKIKSISSGAQYVTCTVKLDEAKSPVCLRNTVLD
jgi:hypothetical protein